MIINMRFFRNLDKTNRNNWFISNRQRDQRKRKNIVSARLGLQSYGLQCEPVKGSIGDHMHLICTIFEDKNMLLFQNNKNVKYTSNKS